MTAENNETQNSTKDETKKTETEVFVLPIEIIEIFEFLSLNAKIVFKSQQIDDPELESYEKVSIARDIYIKNRQTFLMRFGSYLEEHHLQNFARLSAIAPPLRSDEHCDEIQFMLKDYQRKLHTRKKDVKNRRYTALQQLIEKGEYFSEQEMMKRSPELYQELIGQYLSATEKQQRDSYDVKNTTFSGILMHTMERKEMNDMLREADRENKTKANMNMDEEDLQTETIGSQQTALSNDHDDDLEDVPVSYRQQWGNFDNEKIDCSIGQTKLQAQFPNSIKTIIPQVKPDQEKFITAGERDLLRQEFIGIMHAQFLAGNDKDFDYTQVDDNSQLDDLQQLNQDKEDEYFEESDPEDNNGQEEINEIIRDQEESEDELDIFMNHLIQHHSLQQ